MNRKNIFNVAGTELVNSFPLHQSKFPIKKEKMLDRIMWYPSQGQTKKRD